MAWGAAAMARRETVAKEPSAQMVSQIVSSYANSSCLAQLPCLPCLPPESPLFHLKKSFLLPPAASPARAHPFPPSVDGRSMVGPRPGGRRRGVPAPASPAPVAWGAAAMAWRETVAKESSAQAVSRIVSSCANSRSVAVAVVDANAVISSGGAALASTAGRLVTVI